MLVNSFFLLVFFILLFFLGYHFYLISKSYTTSSFFTLFFNNNTKAALLLPPLIYFLSILGAIIFGYYFLIIVPLLLLLNLWLKSPYLVYFIHFLVLIRLLWFFSPFEEIFLMTSPFRSFTCVFSLVSYVFFIYHHKIVLLWVGSFLRVLVGVGIGDIGMVYGGLGVVIENKPPTLPLPTPSVAPQTFFDTISTHKHAAITHNTDSLIRKPYLFGDKLLKPWERVYLDTAKVSAAEQAKFLKYGGCGRMLANFEVLAQALGKTTVIKTHGDGYEKEMVRVANESNLPEPDRTLVTVDWSLAQENEEFIAIKSYVETHFPNERIKLERGYGPVDFILTRQDGSQLLVDVTSLSDDNLTKNREVLNKKLAQLATIDRIGSKTKVLLYNYHHNSSAFFNAPILDSRIITVSNIDVQQFFDLHNINVDFLKPVEKSLQLFSFSNTEAAIKYPTLPIKDAIKTIQFIKK